MACFLLPVVRQIALEHPDVVQTTFLDDRTGLAKSRPALQRVVQVWDHFEQVTRMTTNAGKTQFWARNPQATAAFQAVNMEAGPTMHALGMTLGPETRARSAKEAERAKECQHQAQRLHSLPISMGLKRQVAAAALAPTAAWGLVLNGRAPTLQEQSAYRISYNNAVKTAGLTKGRASVELRKVAFLGHWSDLLFMVVSKTVAASARWARKRALQGHQVSWTPKFVGFLSSLLRKWGWRAFAGGLRDGANRTLFCLGCDQATVDRTLHLLRTRWRGETLSDWVNSDRRDARIARAVRLNPHGEVLHNKLKSLLQGATGHEIAVATGGMAHRCCPNALQGFQTSCCCSDLR